MRKFGMACQPDSRLSKNSLLALLDSQIDEDKAVVAATGQVLDISAESATTVTANMRNGVWLPFETSSPRKLLLYTQDWTITSFDPRTKQVCVTINANSGPRTLGITLRETTWTG